jgi:hypothetical protein
MIKIYGECVSETAQTQVTISQLAPHGCRFLARAGSGLADGELALWIGAIGPLPIVASRDGSNTFTARFKQPLEPAIIEHFNA